MTARWSVTKAGANPHKKAHRNGLKKVKTQRHPSLKGVCPKFVRNQRFAKKGSAAALKQE
ncbi:60S ribosomal protein L29 [Dissophora ornata]|nr:60S ribosomal protein L29 [Dissophora ornata]